MNFSRSKWLMVMFGLLISTIFIIPLYIHPFKLTVSPSSDYQFNNIVAVLIMLVLLLIGSIICVKYFMEETDFNNIEDIVKVSNQNSLLNVKHIYVAFAIFLVAIAFFYTIGADFGFAEANYFLLRIDRIKIGQVPYKDFEYAYGVLLLYFPFLLTRLFNVSTVQAYYIAYTIFNYLGLFFLHFVINSFNINIKAKKYLFYSIIVFCIPVAMGVNYTLFRFITPVMCLIVINIFLKKTYTSQGYHVLIISALSFVSVVLALIISIEVGIAVALSIGCYFYSSFLFNRNFKHLFIAITYSFLIILFALFFNKDLVLTLKTFAAGGNNFPVIPAPAILLYVITFLFINSILLSLVIKKKLYFIFFTLLVFNVVMLPGAFGRCDPAHIFWYGLCSFICMWVYLSYSNHRLYKAYTISFILIFTVGSTLCSLFLARALLASETARFIATHPSLRSSLNNGLQMLHVDNAKVNRYLDKKKPPNNFKKIDSCGLIAFPFDGNKSLYLHVLEMHKYVPDYYTGFFINTFTPEQIAARLAELKNAKHVYMVIPQYVYNYKPVHPDEKEGRNFISTLFLFPFQYNRKMHSEDLYTPVYNYLRTNYKVIEKYNSEYLIERL